jgi:hypothetical protein
VADDQKLRTLNSPRWRLLKHVPCDGGARRIARLDGDGMSDEAWMQLTELSIICGMNQRYWQTVESAGGGWIVFAMLSAFLVVGMCISLLMAAVQDWRFIMLALLCAVLPVSGLVSDVPFIAPRDLPSPRLSQQWRSLKREIDLAIVNEEADRVRDFQRMKIELNAHEPYPPSERLLLRCLKAEEKSRGVK